MNEAVGTCVFKQQSEGSAVTVLLVYTLLYFCRKSNEVDGGFSAVNSTHVDLTRASCMLKRNASRTQDSP